MNRLRAELVASCHVYRSSAFNKEADHVTVASKGSPVQRRVTFAVILMQHSDAETIDDF